MCVLSSLSESQGLLVVEKSVAGGDRGVEPIVSVLTDTRKVTFNSLRFYVKDALTK